MMNMNEKYTIENLNRIIEISRYYIYDKDYDKHIKKINKLIKKIEKGDESKYNKKEEIINEY